MTLTVTDSDSTSFDKVFIPNTVEVRNGVFEAVSTYIRPEEEVPEGLRNFSFFFRDTAIGTGSRIFDEPAGSTFQVSGAIPNEDGVDYFEIVPNPLSPDGSETWLPANYSGTVRITADDMVEFDLSFTDGIKTRQLFAVYQFQSFDVSRPAGNCD